MDKMEKEAEKVDPREKESCLSYIKMMSAGVLFLGVCSIGVGIAVLVLLDGAKYPLTSGTGIWMSGNHIAFGCVGIAAAMATNEITQMKLLNGHYVVSILLMTQGYPMATSIQGLIVCANGDEKCGSNSDALAALQGVQVGILVLSYFIGIASMVLHNKKKCVLHPEWKYRRGCCGGSSCD
ncbi:uncharacterized protein LOC133178192 [Saccostrea echinata]|uniref:uncharacterized protein LOC133178192 n=1 Tax=Saccostrea echinata TaxID=191078 RepID=UPI002A7FD816|nr:uncharacterized protein LOC133178192 [Saccostrea echinata]